jgi:hypothetical protein
MYSSCPIVRLRFKMLPLRANERIMFCLRSFVNHVRGESYISSWLLCSSCTNYTMNSPTAAVCT